MTTTHTPGPWTYVEKCKGTVHVVLGPDGSLICQPPSGKNANLIAAAPELLEALKAMIANPRPAHDSVGNTEDRLRAYSNAWAQAEAAIAKAEGR